MNRKKGRIIEVEEYQNELKVKLSVCEVARCMEFGHVWAEYKRENLGENKKAFTNTPDYKRKGFGKMGELCFSKFIRLPVDWSLHLDNDKGIDFTLEDGRTVDVKATPRVRGDLVFNPNEFFADVGVLVYVPHRTYYVHDLECIIYGFIPREEFLEYTQDKDYGYGMRWKVSVDMLIDIEAL